MLGLHEQKFGEALSCIAGFSKSLEFIERQLQALCSQQSR